MSGYIGAGEKAARIRKLFLGKDGLARRVRKMYVGAGGRARLAYASGCEPISLTQRSAEADRGGMGAVSAGKYAVFGCGRSETDAEKTYAMLASDASGLTQMLSRTGKTFAESGARLGSFGLLAGGKAGSTYLSGLRAYDGELTETVLRSETAVSSRLLAARAGAKVMVLGGCDGSECPCAAVDDTLTVQPLDERAVWGASGALRTWLGSGFCEVRVCASTGSYALFSMYAKRNGSEKHILAAFDENGTRTVLSENAMTDARGNLLASAAWGAVGTQGSGECVYGETLRADASPAKTWRITDDLTKTLVLSPSAARSLQSRGVAGGEQHMLIGGSASPQTCDVYTSGVLETKPLQAAHADSGAAMAGDVSVIFGEGTLETWMLD